MKLAIALLLLGTTLGAGSAALAAGQESTLTPDTAVARQATGTALDAVLTQIDDDGEEGKRSRFCLLSGDDEDDDDDDDDCEDGDDDDDCTAASPGNTGNPAASGIVAPPKNGLFTNGTAPVVKSN